MPILYAYFYVVGCEDRGCTGHGLRCSDAGSEKCSRVVELVAAVDLTVHKQKAVHYDGFEGVFDWLLGLAILKI